MSCGHGKRRTCRRKRANDANRSGGACPSAEGRGEGGREEEMGVEEVERAGQGEGRREGNMSRGARERVGLRGHREEGEEEEVGVEEVERRTA